MNGGKQTAVRRVERMLRRLETLELGDSSAGVVEDEEEGSVVVVSLDPESADEPSDPSREEEVLVSPPVCAESEDTVFVEEVEGVGVDEEEEECVAAGVDEGALVVKALSF